MNTLILASATTPELSDIWDIGFALGIVILGTIFAVVLAIFGLVLAMMLIFHTLQFFGIAPRGISFHGWVRKNF